MKWEEALSDLESQEFAARLNVVSDMRAFFIAARSEPAVMALYNTMKASGESREDVLGRIYDLAQLEVDRRYENPKDSPLAILLWLTLSTSYDPNYIQAAAELVDRAPQCWYAKKLARRILMPPPTASGNSWTGERHHDVSSAGMASSDARISMAPPAQRLGRLHHVENTARGSGVEAESIEVGR